MAARGAPEHGPNRGTTTTNRIVVCLRSPSNVHWKQHSGELVTPYGRPMLQIAHTHLVTVLAEEREKGV